MEKIKRSEEGRSELIRDGTDRKMRVWMEIIMMRLSGRQTGQWHFKPGLFYHYQSSPISDSLSASLITADSNQQTYHFTVLYYQNLNMRTSAMCNELAEKLNLLLLSGPIRHILRIRMKKVLFLNIMLNAIEKSIVRLVWVRVLTDILFWENKFQSGLAVSV